MYFKIKDPVNNRVTSTTELVTRLDKSTRQTRRYLKNVISSKSTAVEFWTKFIVEFRRQYYKKMKPWYFDSASGGHTS